MNLYNNVETVYYLVIKTFFQMLRSMYFQCFVIIFVVINAIGNAMFVYRHDETDKPRKYNFYLFEVGFTILFNVECIIKILCYGFRNFIRRGIFKFELILCLGSSLNCVKFFYERNYFTYFQTFRLLRLIKASPILEDFVWKIFSPGKKLGGLVIFTIAFICCYSAISLQLFYSVPNLHHFRTFPQVFILRKILFYKWSRVVSKFFCKLWNMYRNGHK